MNRRRVVGVVSEVARVALAERVAQALSQAASVCEPRRAPLAPVSLV